MQVFEFEKKGQIQKNRAMENTAAVLLSPPATPPLQDTSQQQDQQQQQQQQDDLVKVRIFHEWTRFHHSSRGQQKGVSGGQFLCVGAVQNKTSS